ncbi:MAG: hypothetical protein JEY91_06625 [Spirochaetaceae bacterium]|nr:hypothetical protein [Spirochaetaceae bacterium]
MVNLSDKNLQKIGEVSAIVSTASYIFGIGLFAMMMTPLNNPGQAEIFKIFLANISLRIDISDKYLGSLWIAMVSFVPIIHSFFPKKSLLLFL